MNTKTWAKCIGASILSATVSLNSYAGITQANQTLAPQNFSQLGLFGTKNQNNSYVPNEIIIKLNNSHSGTNNPSANAQSPLDRIKQQYALDNERSIVSSQNAAVNNAGLSATSSHPEFSQIFVLEFSHGDAVALANSISQDPDVEYAEPNYIYSSQLVPTDPYYTSNGTWGQSYDDLWGPKSINAEGAWDLTLGENVIVAVIDSGVNRIHPDIAENIWQNPNEIANNNIDDDNNGFIDDVYGWAFATSSNDTNDIGGHGTHAAGTIAAALNNDEGIVGIAPRAQILPIKGLSDQGSGANAGLAASIIYAADMGADVINNSWGGCGVSRTIADAMRYAHEQGVTIVSAAGNSSSPVSRFIPAGLPQSITVAALDAADARADFSNWGMKLDVAAPGVDVLSLLSNDMDTSNTDPSTTIGENLLRANGTSMASPHVAGLAALILSRNPALSSEQVRYILRNSANDLDINGYDISFGFGKANATAAINLVDTLGSNVPNLTAAITSPFFNGYQYGNTLELIGSAYGENFSRYRLSWGFFTMETPINFQEFALGNTPVIDDTLGTFDLTQFSSASEIAIKLEVFDAQNRVQEYFSLIVVDNELKPGWPQYEAPQTNRGDIDTAQTFADITGDGTDEVITSIGNMVVAYHADGSRLPGFPVYFPGLLSSSISIGDLDNDGIDDIIAGIIGHQNQQASIHAIKFDGTNVSGFPVNYQGFAASPDFEIVFGSAPIVVDADNDGELEIAINVRQWATTAEGFGNEQHQMAILNASGDYESGWPITISTQFSYWGGAMAAVDLDKNGDYEFAVVAGRNNLSHLAMYEHSGEKRFGSDLGTNHSFRRIAIEDITKNGRYEILSVGFNTDFEPIATVIDDRGNTLDGWPQMLNDGGGAVTVLTDSAQNKLIVVATDLHFEYFLANGDAFSSPVPVLSNDGTATRIDTTKDIIRVKYEDQGLMFTSGFIAVTSRGIQTFGIYGSPIITKTPGFLAKTPVVGDIDNDGFFDIASVSLDNFSAMWGYQSIPRNAEIKGWKTLGANNARTHSVVTPYETNFASNYPSMSIRGSINGWNSTGMELVDDHTWEITLTFPESTQTIFKFDAHADWSVNFGDNNQDNIAEQDGDNIVTNRSGETRIRFNDETLEYSIQAPGGEDWQRTVVYMYGETDPGQDMFLRGGIDWDYSRNERGIDCADNPMDCAIPIRHNLRPDETTRANDMFLDWYGAEENRGNVEGSPLVWTTNFWPSDWGTEKTLENDGVGLDPENQWGMHYWKLDVMMDCSKTADGWFELKSFISNGPGWESNVSQAGAPYTSNNHFAECGKTNVFRRGESNVVEIL